MKKMRKLLAVLMTLAMVMGLGLTAFAQEDQTTTDNVTPYVADITIEGLAAGDATTINVYQIVSLDTYANNWVVAEWAKEYVDTTTNPLTIDGAGLKAIAADSNRYTYATNVSTTSYKFENLPIGAYLILASGNKATYNVMIAETYKETETYMTAVDVLVDAKTAGYSVDKSADDNFVYRGETVTFTVTTTYPSFEDPDTEGNTYKLIDTPTDLKELSLVSVRIGSVDYTTACTGAYSSTDYVIDLSNTIGDTNEHAGKTVVVVYTAVVANDNGYRNIVNAYRNNVNLGYDNEAGYTGDITITKKAAEENTVILRGAEFEVYDGAKASVTDDSTALSFVYVSDGVYKLAEEDDATTVTTLVATNGTLQVKGLDEGTYWFKETKAPLGYSINEVGVEVTITPVVDNVETTTVDESAVNVSMSDELLDTKLSSLPSTGGIGTTIFTIGGCAIMIAAAYMFFVSRRRDEQ